MSRNSDVADVDIIILNIFLLIRNTFFYHFPVYESIVDFTLSHDYKRLKTEMTDIFSINFCLDCIWMIYGKGIIQRWVFFMKNVRICSFRFALDFRVEICVGMQKFVYNNMHQKVFMNFMRCERATKNGSISVLQMGFVRIQTFRLNSACRLENIFPTISSKYGC